MRDVPTFAKQGLDNYRADLWHGLVACKGTPPQIIAKLKADINAVLGSPEIKAQFSEWTSRSKRIVKHANITNRFSALLDRRSARSQGVAATP